MTKGDLRPEDVILLCSDGLHGQVDDDQILSILRGPGHLREQAMALIQAALDAGAPDNVTVVLGRFNG